MRYESETLTLLKEYTAHACHEIVVILSLTCSLLRFFVLCDEI
jgi:hypothetical protein